MRIPSKESMASFDAEIEDFTDFECCLDDGKLIHKDCGTKIQYSICNISLHQGDTCGGTGEVTSRRIPYCPMCEGDLGDTSFGCVHEPIQEIYEISSKTYSFGFSVPNRDQIISGLIGATMNALIVYALFAFHLFPLK